MFIVETSKIPLKESIINVPMDNPVSVYSTCQELKKLCDEHNGIGISAVQAGIPWKLFLVKGSGRCPLINSGQYGYFIDCEYEKTNEDKLFSFEGCLSIRDANGNLRTFQVPRYKSVRLFGNMLVGDESNLRLESIDLKLNYMQDCIVFQHEIDHQLGPDGLISNKGKEIFA